MALRRMASSRSLAMKVSKARRTPPRKDFGRGLREQETGLAVLDGLRQAPGLVPDRQRAEALGVHLAEPAGLEPRRHQREIAAGKDPPRLRVVEADADADGIRPPPPRVDQRLLDLRLAASGDDDLAAGLDDLVGGRQHEVDALLVHEPGDQTKIGPRETASPNCLRT